jgi:LPXTG-motif cell wall-anchored protein
MLDIRIPIGLLFFVLGIIVGGYGIATMNHAEMYKISANTNINLWSGLGMLVFGGIMLFTARKKKKRLR